MFEFLFETVRDVKKKAYACIVFSDKPTKLLVTGKTRTDKGDGVAINPQILKYLPKFTPEEQIGVQAAIVANSPERRPDWYVASQFANVNRTMCHRVALFCLEMDIDCGSVKDQWISRYGGKPTEVTEGNNVIQSMAPDTRRIFMARILKFREEEPYWSKLLTGELIEEEEEEEDIEMSSTSSEEEGPSKKAKVEKAK
jgi:hypothetical protein